MTKVLEVFGEPISNGGQEAFVVNVIRHMNLAGMQIDLLTPYYCDNPYYREQVHEWNGEIHELGLEFAPGKSRRNLFLKLYRFLKKNHYDVVHIHSGSISVLMYVSFAAKLSGISEIIVHSHSAGERKTLKHRIIKSLAAPVLNCCPTQYCACSTVAGEFKYTSNIVRHRMKLINNGVDLDVFRYDHAKAQKMRTKLGISESARVIGHVGRFSAEKNHSFLISVFAEFHRQNPDSILLLIGSGDLMSNAKQQVRDLHIENAVLFIGNINNVSDYLQVMDVFLLPSKFEGLPIVMVEAQAAGVAVVASDAVTQETALVKYVKFVPLTASIETWVTAVKDAAILPRFDESDQIISKGFDIHSTAKTVREMYISQ